MRGAARLISGAVSGLTAAVSQRNRQVTVAVLLGGATIAAANWFAMSRPEGEAVIGLGSNSASGALVAPAYGGIVTGAIAGFTRRPVYADGRAGTYAAFTGVVLLMVWVIFTRFTGELPAGSAGFERFGPLSAAMFTLIIGAANVFVTFPTAFVIIFAIRSIVPNNRHRYGWLADDDDDLGLDYGATAVNIIPTSSAARGDISRRSTAFSRFNQTPPRFSKVPSRFLDVERE